jgi:hypothetical protein
MTAIMSLLGASGVTLRPQADRFGLRPRDDAI